MFEANVKKEQDQLGFGVLITKKCPPEIRPEYQGLHNVSPPLLYLF